VEQVRGTFRKEGKVVGADADIHLIVEVVVPVKRWYGSFELPVDAPIWGAGEYDLELADGRSGHVLVTHVRLMVGGPKTGRFTGTGPLYEPAL